MQVLNVASVEQIRRKRSTSRFPAFNRIQLHFQVAQARDCKTSSRKTTRTQMDNSIILDQHANLVGALLKKCCFANPAVEDPDNEL